MIPQRLRILRMHLEASSENCKRGLETSSQHRNWISGSTRYLCIGTAFQIERVSLSKLIDHWDHALVIHVLLDMINDSYLPQKNVDLKKCWTPLRCYEQKKCSPKALPKKPSPLNVSSHEFSFPGIIIGSRSRFARVRSQVRGVSQVIMLKFKQRLPRKIHNL